MPEPKVLQLRFVLQSQEAISPTEFLSLFECVDDFARVIAEGEIGAFLEELSVSAPDRLRTLQHIHRLGRRVPSPAEVTEIERGSWIVDVVLTSAAIFILKDLFVPTIRAAWDESRMRQVVQAFVRDKLFLGARRGLEAMAVHSPKYGNLRVIDVREVAPPESQHPAYEVGLERSRILEVRADERELVEQFLQRLRSAR